MRLVGLGRGRLFVRLGGLGGILRVVGERLGGGGLVRGVEGWIELGEGRSWWLCGCLKAGGLGGRLCRLGGG
jgi:hypothetical protein